MKYTHHVVRVQGGDNDLITALDAAGSQGWELVQLIPTGAGATTNPKAEGSWLAVFRKKGN